VRQFRHLSDVGGDAPSLVAGEELKPRRPVLSPLHRRRRRDWYNHRWRPRTARRKRFRLASTVAEAFLFDEHVVEHEAFIDVARRSEGAASHEGERT